MDSQNYCKVRQAAAGWPSWIIIIEICKVRREAFERLWHWLTLLIKTVTRLSFSVSIFAFMHLRCHLWKLLKTCVMYIKFFHFLFNVLYKREFVTEDMPSWFFISDYSCWSLKRRRKKKIPGSSLFDYKCSTSHSLNVLLTSTFWFRGSSINKKRLHYIYEIIKKSY